jgi:hypothetical protein
MDVIRTGRKGRYINALENVTFSKLIGTAYT